jgi:hypothetical protein
LRLPHECLISRVSCFISSWAISANYTRHVQPLSDFVDLVLSPVFSKPGLGVDLFVEHVVDPLLHEFLLSLGLAIDSDHQLIQQPFRLHLHLVQQVSFELFQLNFNAVFGGSH